MLHHKSHNSFASRDRPALLGDPCPPSTESSPSLRPDDPAGRAVVSALQTAVSRIAASDPEVRRGNTEGIHRLRTSIRRLRSELRALEDLVERSWREQVEGELKWLAGMLGGVRDLDILLARLRQAVPKPERDSSGAGALAPLFPALEARRTQAARALNDALESDRYRSLLETLKRAAERPALMDAACVSCRASLPPAAAAAWRRLKKAARGLRPSDPDEEFHVLRKRAKRARYTAELVAPVLRRRAARAAGRFIRLTTQIQDTLGEHQDATEATREIRHALAGHADDPAFVQAAESLLETQRKSARATRAEFFKIWAKLDRKKLRRWIKPQPKTLSS
ncbi:MAG: CHAD domain-containing protein [Isosphaerales bacterium]